VKRSRAVLVGLAIGSAVAVLFALGPLASATLITVGVETQVGAATGLPSPWMLPAALEGLGAVALAYLITFAPKGALRQWCKALIGGSLLAGMAAQGSHALWFDEATGRLVLPWLAKLLISFVPPASGLAALHLVVKAAEGLFGAVRALHALPGRAAPAGQRADARALDQTPERALATLADSATTARTPRTERAATTARTDSVLSARKRAANGSRADQMRALLAEPGGRALTGTELGARLGIDAGRARSIRAEVERADAETARRPHLVEPVAVEAGA
jgi:hypothetical protein